MPVQPKTLGYGLQTRIVPGLWHHYPKPFVHSTVTNICRVPGTVLNASGIVESTTDKVSVLMKPIL